MSMTPEHLQAAIAGGMPVNLVDVRTPAEFAAEHLAGAQSIPLERLDDTVVDALARASSRCVLICASGRRARAAREKLAAAGAGAVSVLEGGMAAWVQAGLPVVRGKGVISLERQVRIAAGLLVLAGVLLGRMVHPAFYALSGLVGTGLVFAGITDWCGMALLLARMPWNQARPNNLS
jgi:rhodanese-related sulfurtransferase